MYNKIYDFCAVKNLGTMHKNTNEPTPRVQFLMDLLSSENIPYTLDKYEVNGGYGYNLIMRGSPSGNMVMAHHDIVNPESDNANDNSASVINAIMVKKLSPSINVALVDGEEVGGVGSTRVAKQIKAGKFGNIKSVLNFELTGKGGKNFLIGNYDTALTNKIKKLYDCPIFNTPFNDAISLLSLGINAALINPIPAIDIDMADVENYTEMDVYSFGNKVTYKGKSIRGVVHNGKLYDYSVVFNCHRTSDSVQTIDTSDMKEFVEEVVKFMS